MSGRCQRRVNRSDCVATLFAQDSSESPCVWYNTNFGCTAEHGRTAAHGPGRGTAVYKMFLSLTFLWSCCFSVSSFSVQCIVLLRGGLRVRHFSNRYGVWVRWRVSGRDVRGTSITVAPLVQRTSTRTRSNTIVIHACRTRLEST